MGNDLSRPVPKERPMAFVRRVFGNMTRQDVIDRLVTVTLKNDDSRLRKRAAKANLSKHELSVYYEKIGRFRGEFCTDIPEIEYREFPDDYEDDCSSLSSSTSSCPDIPGSPISPMFADPDKQKQFEKFCKTKYGTILKIKRSENTQDNEKDKDKTDGQHEKSIPNQEVELRPNIAGDGKSPVIKEPSLPVIKEPSLPVIQQEDVVSPGFAKPTEPLGFQIGTLSPSKAALEVPKFSSPSKQRMMHTPVEVKPLVILPHHLRCDSDVPVGMSVQEASSVLANPPRQPKDNACVPPQELEKPSLKIDPMFANPTMPHGADSSKAEGKQNELSNAFEVQSSGPSGRMAHTPVPIKKLEVLPHHLVPCDTELPLYLDPSRHQAVNKPAQSVAMKPDSTFANPSRPHGTDSSKAGGKQNDFSDSFEAQFAGPSGRMVHTPVPIKRHEVLSHHVVPCDTELPIYMDPSRHRVDNKPAQSVVAGKVSQPPVSTNPSRQPGESVDEPLTELEKFSLLLDSIPTPPPGGAVVLPPELTNFIPNANPTPNQAGLSRNALCPVVGIPAPRRPNERNPKCKNPRQIGVQTDDAEIMSMLPIMPDPRFFVSNMSPQTRMKPPAQSKSTFAKPRRQDVVQKSSRVAVRSNSTFAKPTRQGRVQESSTVSGRSNSKPTMSCGVEPSSEPPAPTNPTFANPTRPCGVKPSSEPTAPTCPTFANPTRPVGVEDKQNESSNAFEVQLSGPSGRMVHTPVPIKRLDVLPHLLIPCDEELPIYLDPSRHQADNKPAQPVAMNPDPTFDNPSMPHGTDPSNVEDKKQKKLSTAFEIKFSGPSGPPPPTNPTFANPTMPCAVEQSIEPAVSTNPTFAKPTRLCGTDSSNAEDKKQKQLSTAFEIKFSGPSGPPPATNPTFANPTMPCAVEQSIEPAVSTNPTFAKPTRPCGEEQSIEPAVSTNPTFANPTRPCAVELSREESAPSNSTVANQTRLCGTEPSNDKKQNKLSTAFEIKFSGPSGPATLTNPTFANPAMPCAVEQSIEPAVSTNPTFANPTRSSGEEQSIEPAVSTNPTFANPTRSSGVEPFREESVPSNSTVANPTRLCGTEPSNAEDKKQNKLSTAFEIKFSGPSGPATLTNPTFANPTMSCGVEQPSEPSDTTNLTFDNPTRPCGVEPSSEPPAPTNTTFANPTRPCGVEPSSEPPAQTNSTFANPTRPCGEEQSREATAPFYTTFSNPTGPCGVPTTDKPVGNVDAMEIPIFTSQSSQRVVHTPVPIKPAMRPDQEVPVFTSPSKQPVANSPVPRLQLLPTSPGGDIPVRVNEAEQLMTNSTEESMGKASPAKSKSRMLGKIGSGLLSRNTATPKPKASTRKPVATNKPAQKKIADASSSKPVTTDKPAQKNVEASSRKPVATDKQAPQKNFAKETAASRNKRLAGFLKNAGMVKEEVGKAVKDGTKKKEEEGKILKDGTKVKEEEGKAKGIVSRCISSIKRRTESAMSNHKVIKVKPATPDCTVKNDTKQAQSTQRSGRTKAVTKVEIPLSNLRPDKGIIWPTEFHDLSSHGKAYYVEQFRRSEKFKQRLARKTNGGDTWMNGMNPFQLWVVENEGTSTMYDILNPVPKAQSDAQAKVKCWRGKESPLF